ncbi:fumarylacetoacetate hydrolase family protein [bacterium]|nr:fumarylacetoacetate hydrolase family protein [bacterium]
MRIARYHHEDYKGFGLVEDGRVYPVQNPFIAETDHLAAITASRTGHGAVSLSRVRLLSPCVPSKIVCVGVNYAAHAREMGRADLPKEPLIFLKAPSAVIGPGDPIVRPAISERVDHEAEIAIVIARTCRNVPPEEALSVVLGYTCLNDVTARDLQRRDVQFSRAKSFDTFCPMGPWIETGLDSTDAGVEAWVNGEKRQDGRTSDLIFGVPALIAHITRVMTLYPGDVIATGTPEGVSPLLAGDEVTVTVEGIGSLTNPVVDEE